MRQRSLIHQFVDAGELSAKGGAEIAHSMISGYLKTVYSNIMFP